MNKKILSIIAASAAVMGSAIAAPAHAQTANLPVQITVKPGIFLRTYSDLKFVVSTQDLQGGASVDQMAGSYDETTGTLPSLPTTPPPNTPTDTIIKTVNPLYQLYGGTSTTSIKIAASQPTLTGAASAGLGGTSDTITMSVDPSSDVSAGSATAPSAGNPYLGSAKLSFKFGSPNSATAGRTYTGGQLTISVINP
jgi:hypothetical protein